MFKILMMPQIMLHKNSINIKQCKLQNNNSNKHKISLVSNEYFQMSFKKSGSNVYLPIESCNLWNYFTIISDDQIKYYIVHDVKYLAYQELSGLRYSIVKNKNKNNEWYQA